MLHNAEYHFKWKDVQHTRSAYIKCQDVQLTISVKEGCEGGGYAEYR